MPSSSPHVVFDSRLLAIEELFRQRQYAAAVNDLSQLSEAEFSSLEHEHGLFLLLQAEGAVFEGEYKKAVESGLKSAKLLADLPFNQRYGRVQLVLSKAYSATGDLKNAEIRARDALAAFRRAADTVGQVDSLNELGHVAYIRCDYHAAESFLTDALAKVSDNPRKIAQLTGNIATLQVFTGRWEEAEANLNQSLAYNVEQKYESSQAVNYLSRGYLRLRRRQFVMARRDLDAALEIVGRLGLKREKVIYLVYAGEWAMQKGDFLKAKMLFSDAYQKGNLRAPGSSLVSQAARCLAETELALDNLDEAMKYSQKA
ncbi:MAG TPA: hypothetical protein VN285_09750, partial [Candidatus Deferrimicrobium sp.]|nr:hypothetical protein [Candidatus Deferrimicrobium sp.]